MRLHRWLILIALIAGLAAITGYTLVFSSPAPAAPPAQVAADPNPEGFKQLAAPPSDFLSGMLRLPDPAQLGQRSGYAMLPVRLAPAAQGQTGSIWTANVPVDAAGDLQWLLLAPAGSDWTLRLTPPNRETLSLGGEALPAGARRTETSVGMSEFAYPATIFSFDAAQPTGMWRVEVRSQQPVAQSGATTGFVVVSSASPYRLYSYVDRLGLVAGEPGNLVAYLYDQAADVSKGHAPAPLAATIESAEATILRADAGPGSNQPGISLPLAADGAGVLRGAIPALPAGNHTLQVTVRGTTPEGQPFVRTSEHLFAVVARSLALAGQAQAAPQDGVRLRVDLAMTGDATQVSAVQASAEVWGTAKDGSATPVAWIGGLAAPVADAAGTRVSLVLDGHWIALAQAQAPFELRNVRLQDRNQHVPLSVIERMPLAVVALPASVHELVDAPTQEMLMGQRPGWLAAEAPQPANRSTYGSQNHRLMLVHGYCSSDVWQQGQANGNFTTHSLRFLDLAQNRSHDQFALLIRSFGQANVKSYGIVAHSQGGAASLHLYKSYWSGLDWVDFDVADGARLIQSVGTPYQGTALAGNLAWLGTIFGTGCGSNTDLTYAGAAAWLSTVPSAARSKVYYYSTGENSIWPWNSCTGADILLDDPNDGVTEDAYADLVNGNDMGYTDEQCHVAGAPYLAQFHDAGRNSTMDAQAKH